MHIIGKILIELFQIQPNALFSSVVESIFLIEGSKCQWKNTLLQVKVLHL